MTRIIPWLMATVLFMVGCVIPLVLGHASYEEPAPACICPTLDSPLQDAPEVDFNDVPGTPPSGELKPGEKPHHDFILFDSVLAGTTYRR